MNKTLIVLVGGQASGKTTLAKTVLPDFFRVSQDEMGPRRHEIEFAQALERGDNIVIDKTNGRAEYRAKYVKAAKEKGYDVSAVYLDIAFNTCHERLLNRKEHRWASKKTKLVIGLKRWFKDKRAGTPRWLTVQPRQIHLGHTLRVGAR